MSISITRLAAPAVRLGRCSLVAAALFPAAPLAAQEEPIRPGEAVVTRFSGTAAAQPDQSPVINLDGTVASIIDLRSPAQPPEGQHWIDEPQRAPVTARQVGQVFGLTLDDAASPNAYLAATSAFGLHRIDDNTQWMPGMWGPGGPGAIYKLDAANGYAPRLFSKITLNGRENTGPGLGNIAYDRANKQLFVSDLETGMIHRISAADGSSLGHYDHGVQGRVKFVDAASGETKEFPPIAFDPATQARIGDCPSEFETSPQCWNFAASGRRVWGVAVRHNPGGESRLYYAVWSGPAFGQTAWNQADEDDKRNAVWSVRLGPDGRFDPSDVRREFQIPDFFVKPEDIARAGYSQPVSDITFASCGPRPVMLLAERGGIRNLGLGEPNGFAYPHEARALRYERDQAGNWRPVGRYDVGFYERRKEGPPYLRANCSGGIAFGPGYDESSWTANTSEPDKFVWMTGDALCSLDGPCNLPVGDAPEQPDEVSQNGQPQQVADASELRVDDSEVHGVQGLAETAFGEVAPVAAYAASPPETPIGNGPSQSYLIDTDKNIDAAGGLIEEELVRNDQTRIGDIAVHQACTPPAAYAAAMLLPPVVGIEPPPLVGHSDAVSHARIASHGRAGSHYRFGSHNLSWSHNRFGSHYRRWSHNRTGSHSRWRSHNRVGSHNRRESHSRHGSHTRALSHWRRGSHNQRLSHRRFHSHNPVLSHRRKASHSRRLSHQRLGSHRPALSHARLRSHTRALSHVRTGSHRRRLSHTKHGSHSTIQSGRKPVHKVTASHARTGSHTRALSRPAHKVTASHQRTGSHTRAQSGHHDRLKSQIKSVHSKKASHNRSGSHTRALSRRKQPPTAKPTQPRPPRATPSRPRPPKATPSKPRPPKARPSKPRPPRATPSRPRPPRATPSRPRPPRATPSRPRPPRAAPSRPRRPDARPSRPRPPQAKPAQPRPSRVAPSRPRPPRATQQNRQQRKQQQERRDRR